MVKKQVLVSQCFLLENGFVSRFNISSPITFVAEKVCRIVMVDACILWRFSLIGFVALWPQFTKKVTSVDRSPIIDRLLLIVKPKF